MDKDLFKIYFNCLNDVLTKYGYSGYSIGEKKEGCICIYKDDHFVNVSKIVNGEATNYSFFHLSRLWNACKEFLSLLIDDKEKLKEITDEWTTHATLLERKNEPHIYKAIKYNDFNSFLDKYVPSIYYKEYLKKSDRIFNDREKATIIYNSSYPLQDTWQNLKLIADNTDDKELRAQIEERISFDKEALNKFKENDGSFFYAVNSHEYEDEDFILGYYKNFKDAFNAGYRSTFKFDIRKHELITGEDPSIKGRNYSMDIFPDKFNDHYDLAGNPVAEFKFDGNEIYYYSSYETDEELDRKLMRLGNKRFEDAYVSLPNPFDKFDLVYDLRDFHTEFSPYIVETSKEIDLVYDSRGFFTTLFNPYIVETSKEYWQEMDKRALKPDAIDEYYDASLYLGRWNDKQSKYETDIHISPLYLNKAAVNCAGFDAEEPVMIGFNTGNAVWISPVIIKDSERITSSDVEETGINLSIEEEFFNDIFKELFLKHFDANLPVNKKRFTRVFDDKGRFLTGFEEQILEYNFFTRESIEWITYVLLAREEKLLENDKYKDVIFLTKPVKKFCDILSRNLELTDAKYFGVMS